MAFASAPAGASAISSSMIVGGTMPDARIAAKVARLSKGPLLELGAVGGEREQMVELHLADDIAWPVAGLAQI